MQLYNCTLFQKGPNIIAMSKFVPDSPDFDFWTNHVQTNFRSLQSYLVPIENDCNYIWAASELRLQSYLGPFVINIAIIFSPNQKKLLQS